jgi:hypothetical protein
LAERLCRKADRIDPSRVYRPCRCFRRGALTPNPEILRALLQWITDSSLSEQRRSSPSRDRAHRCPHLTADPWWTSPPILQNLVFGTHKGQDKRSGPFAVILARAHARRKPAVSLRGQRAFDVAMHGFRERAAGGMALRHEIAQHRDQLGIAALGQAHHPLDG